MRDQGIARGPGGPPPNSCWKRELDVYRLLFRLYPADFRARFESEMIAAREESGGGAGEIFGLIAGAFREWIAKWTTNPVIRARAMPDWRLMRPVGVTRKDFWGDAPAELIHAQKRVDDCVNRMVYAIAHYQFEQARFYSNEDIKAREHLRRVRAKYGIA